MVTTATSENTFRPPPSPPPSTWLSVKVEPVMATSPNVATPPPSVDVLPVNVTSPSVIGLSESWNSPPPGPSMMPPVTVTLWSAISSCV